MSARKKDFKIGCFHGKLSPKSRSREAKLRNDLYLIGMLRINISLIHNIDIRLVSYEMPLEDDKQRGPCIDLFGYDSDYNPFLIELKMDNSKEELPQVIKQIKGYEIKFKQSKKYIEKEIQLKFHWPSFKLTDEVKKVILAPREYYEKRSLKDYIHSDIYICSLARVRDIFDPNDDVILLDKFGSKGCMNLKLENR